MVDTGVGHGCYVAFLVLAGILICASIGLGIVGVVYEKWMYYTVEGIPTDSYSKYEYYSRSRGIFWECVTDTNSPVLITYRSFVTKGNCFTVDLFLTDPCTAAGTCGSIYWYIIQMRITHLSLLILGLFIDFIGLILAIVALFLLCDQHKKHKNLHDRVSQIVVGSLFLIGGLTSMSSFVIFHCFISAEKEAPASEIQHIYANWPPALKYGTSQTYGAAYVITWVYVACSIFAGIILLSVRKYTCCQCAMEKTRREPDSIHSVYGRYPTAHVDFSADTRTSLNRVSTYDLDVPSYYSTQLTFQGKPNDAVGKGHENKGFQ